MPWHPFKRGGSGGERYHPIISLKDKQGEGHLVVVRTCRFAFIVNVYVYIYSVCFCATAEISKHLANEQTKAALRIQTIWKGYRIRQGLETKKLHVKRIRAAIKIQRVVSFVFCELVTLQNLCSAVDAVIMGF